MEFIGHCSSVPVPLASPTTPCPAACVQHLPSTPPTDPGIKINLNPPIKRSHSAPDLPDADSMPRVVLGVCAMDKKAESKPMRNILSRLNAFNEFEIFNFGDQCILDEPVENWPTCQCLLSWHSDGFPLQKAKQYVALRKPFLVNDVFTQELLLDRRRVYQVLKENSIPVPRHIVVNRDDLPEGMEDPPGFIEDHDYVEMDGYRIDKPFVEKPSSGEDHNVYIYYPHSMGGGVKRLFRKVDNKSADYDATHPGTVRRNGSFLYEEFLPTGGTDVKVYTVGPRYAHAEARKSPVVDGKVQRTADGKEMRFPVLLTPQEKEIARMVTLAFGQKVCGFDLLRCDSGKVYVCDVNGWSFVKNSKRYYDDCSCILRSIVLSALAPSRLAQAPRMLMPLKCDDDPGRLPQVESIDGLYLAGTLEEEGVEVPYDMDEELRCVLAIVRHGDRTPKQKMKMKVSQPALLELFDKYKDSKGKQAKLKSPNQLQELLDITRQLLAGMDATAESLAAGQPCVGEGDREDMEEQREKFRIVRTVLEHGGSFSGVNRKVQLKPCRWGEQDYCTEPQGSPHVQELLLILKYGGVLTHAGRKQAEDLGNVFRTVMYPMYGPAGGGLLRLHSTYRHDLKIYSSDEGRVQVSAAAFTKGLLDLEGNSVTPILVSLVQKNASMLDAFDKGASESIREAKTQLYTELTWDPDKNMALHKQVPNTVPPTPLMGSPPQSPKPEPSSSAITTPTSKRAPPVWLSAVQNQYHERLISRFGQVNFKGFSSREDSTGELADAASAAGGEDTSAGCGDEAVQPAQPPLKLRIKNFPDKPLEKLHALVQAVKVLVNQLREKCLVEVTAGNAAVKSYSSLMQAPEEWDLEFDRPCGGERLLLMFDRWRKLLKSFYNEKKGQFDISKIPDIYDSAKYDAIHNSHLDLDLEEVYRTAKVMADVVIPNEYGIDPEDKLHIGSKICGELLGKLLADLANMREESRATYELEQKAQARTATAADYLDEIGATSLADDIMRMTGGRLSTITSSATMSRSSAVALAGLSSEGLTQSGSLGSGHGPTDDEAETLHRLCPAYASDVNSPLRHVRTRVYFTSESHIHSLVNVLRHCQDNAPEGLVSPAGCEVLDNTTEFDYLTHIVVRMYENKRHPVESPARYRVELEFSPGAAYNPFEVMPLKNNHVQPVVPRKALHPGRGVTLALLEDLLGPYSILRKTSPSIYALQVALKAPSNPMSRIGSSASSITFKE